MLRLKAVPEESAAEMLARTHGGFSINGEVRPIEADDRSALKRLLGYVLRPALSVKQLSYQPEKRPRLSTAQKRAGRRSVGFEWKPVEFLARFARLIPPRGFISCATMGRAGTEIAAASCGDARGAGGDFLRGATEGVPAAGIREAMAGAERILRKAASARGWARGPCACASLRSILCFAPPAQAR